MGKPCYTPSLHIITNIANNTYSITFFREELDKAKDAFLETAKIYEDEHLGNYRRIYPKDGYEKYDKFFQHSGSLFQETAAFKARSECARQQREEILRKQEKLESMLKKTRNKDGVRPESPGIRRRKLRRSNVPTRRFGHTTARLQPDQTGVRHQLGIG